MRPTCHSPMISGRGSRHQSANAMAPAPSPAILRPSSSSATPVSSPAAAAGSRTAAWPFPMTSCDAPRMYFASIVFSRLTLKSPCM